MKTQCMSCGGSMSKGGKTPVKTMKKVVLQKMLS